MQHQRSVNEEERLRRMIEDADLSTFPWWKIGLSKDQALSGLVYKPPGSFVLRDSESNPSAYDKCARSSICLLTFSRLEGWC